jgi:hypothetical protein
VVSPTVIQKYVNLGGIIVVSPTVIQKYVNLGGIIVVSPTVFIRNLRTSEPRAIAQSGGSLPGAREISVILHTPRNVEDLGPDISYMVIVLSKGN